jgi:hypothetical protein
VTFDNIRLSPQEIAALGTAFRAHFGSEDHLWLFGSRVNPQALGGDIDLYIETTIADARQALDAKSAFLYSLYEKIGLQRIDVVLNLLSGPHLPIYTVAKDEGVRIV